MEKKRDPLLVLEYCEHGTLYDLIHNETFQLEGEILLPILRDMSQGIRYLHSASPPIIHSDLKSSNILITRGFRAKISDFGLSQKKQPTPFFMAPELLKGKASCSSTCDIYSFGMILYELYSRKDPYDDAHESTLFKTVRDSGTRKRPTVPYECPTEIARLMKSCWKTNPSKRPTATEIDENLKLFLVENVQPKSDSRTSKSRTLDHKPKTLSNTDFLYKVFPRHVADCLVQGEKVEPESHECVTIFFSDICDFTNISGTSSALKISDMLDRLYTIFDGLSKKHQLFKVETIGMFCFCMIHLFFSVCLRLFFFH